VGSLTGYAEVRDVFIGEVIDRLCRGEGDVFVGGVIDRLCRGEGDAT